MTQAAGWYDDGTGTVRWWDGARWTEHVQPQQSPPQAPGYGPPQPFAQPGPSFGTPAPRRSRRGLILGILGGVVLLIAGGIVGVVLLVQSMTAGPREAVEEFNDAYLDADCSGVQEVLSAELWPVLFTDCTQFEAAATTLVASLEGGEDGFSVRITSTNRVNSLTTIETVETFRYADGTEETEHVTYSLQQVGDDWEIWDIYSE